MIAPCIMNFSILQKKSSPLDIHIASDFFLVFLVGGGGREGISVCVARSIMV